MISIWSRIKADTKTKAPARAKKPSKNACQAASALDRFNKVIAELDEVLRDTAPSTSTSKVRKVKKR